MIDLDGLHSRYFESNENPILLVNTIMECVTTASLKVLWNGKPSEPLYPT